jgi:hypothetical protein
MTLLAGPGVSKTNAVEIGEAKESIRNPFPPSYDDGF